MNTCIICGKEFEAPKYSKAKYCSKECRSHAGIHKTCKYCGKEFLSKNAQTVCCGEAACVKAKEREWAERKKTKHIPVGLIRMNEIARQQGKTYGKLMEEEQIRLSDELMKQRRLLREATK